MNFRLVVTYLQFSIQVCFPYSVTDTFITDIFLNSSRVFIVVGFFITSPAGAVAKYCDEYVGPYVCLSVPEDISRITRAIFTIFLCVLPKSVARFSSGMLTIGRIAYRREGGDGSAQRGRNVIYDSLVYFVILSF